MELAQLIDSLSKPAAYPHPVDAVEVHQTHISVVFLAGTFAYKIKKPVELGFLDFRTLAQRRHFCEEEVRLNRRLAPAVYRGVVPIVATNAGAAIDQPGEAVEWAVKMERLPEEATLDQRLRRGDIDVGIVQTLAERIAAFHAEAETNERIASFGQFDVVARNARENFVQGAPQVGVTVTQTVFDRLRVLMDNSLELLRPVVEGRARRGIPRDTHGDLHLDHVYLFPEREPPDDLLIIDCIEFNERFRFADPIADAAFLVMDMTFHGRRDLAQAFAAAYIRASKDEEGRRLLPFYTSYRAVVRAKVEGFELTEKEIPESERRAARTRAQGHWLLALGEMEAPERKPCLVLVGGLPGTGKSVLARGLAERAGCHWVRSDSLRKELAALRSDQSARAHFGEGVYNAEWNERTYGACLERTERLLHEGKRVAVDASFGEERQRQRFLDLAARLAVPAIFFLCEVAPDIARGRLERRRNDASDADWSVYQKAAGRWDDIGPSTRLALRTIDTSGTPEEVQLSALDALRAEQVMSERPNS
jgi:aminoglycoside phosphotransferase family enzyme/predicted kinase